MEKSFRPLFVLAFSLLFAPVFSQTVKDTPLLGLPGDNLDLYAVLDLFQKSKTIEDFEKTLNDSKTGINNMDLNLDTKIDFIKVAAEVYFGSTFSNTPSDKKIARVSIKPN
jgi:hypothetical protein